MSEHFFEKHYHPHSLQWSLCT